MTDIDIHNYPRWLERERELARSSLSARNFELAERFEDHCTNSNLALATTRRYLYDLRRIAGLLGKDFDKAGVGDIERVVNQFSRSDYAPSTKLHLKIVLKTFYKWLRGGEVYPPEVKWIKTTMSRTDALLPGELLTEDDVLKLVEAAGNPRDKAFIFTLYESGGRIGEVGRMRIRDASFEKGYTRLYLKGKTGPRRVIVIASTQYLMTWIQNHPLKDDRNAPLWVNLGRNPKRYKSLRYCALADILKIASEKAGLKKRIHPHLLRHSRATFLASRLTEAQMNQVFGWAQGSLMPRIYVHLSGRDVDDALLGVYGLKKVEGRTPKLMPKVCPRCHESNDVGAKLCRLCGLVLDIRVAETQERKTEESEERIKQLERKLEELTESVSALKARKGELVVGIS